ncbi:MAG: methyltransferase domain-containing protein [Pseudomonadota bacterium]
MPHDCPICGYHGIFIGVGRPPRWDARCLQCGSRERHRLLHLWVIEGGGNMLAGKRILHFAPEKTVVRQMRGNKLYETADLRQKATHQLDISRIDLPDAGYDVVMAHHVLEHVDQDRAAMPRAVPHAQAGRHRAAEHADQPVAAARPTEKSCDHRAGAALGAFRQRGP